MLKRIVVGMNRTPESGTAVDAAIALAAEHGAELLGVAVVDEPRLTAPEPVPLGGTAYKAERDEAVISASEAEVQQLLREFAQRCQTEGIAYRASPLTGDAAGLLVGEAQLGDLLVIGHHSPSSSSDTTHTFQRVVRNAPRPVLATPGALTLTAPVLVAYDGSAQAAKSLQAFLLLGMARQRRIHLLSVSPASSHFNPAALAADYLQLHGLAADVINEQTDAAAATVILSVAERLGAGLIVMGSYGRPVVQEFFLGSVTRSVLKESRLPLFLFH